MNERPTKILEPPSKEFNGKTTVLVIVTDKGKFTAKALAPLIGFKTFTVGRSGSSQKAGVTRISSSHQRPRGILSPASRWSMATRQVLAPLSGAPWEILCVTITLKRYLAPVVSICVGTSARWGASENLS